ncbi:MAG: CotH kinase family protein [Alkaliphilus sp.]|nr:CotH kinase family protein [Alkaliphilus sp.]
MINSKHLNKIVVVLISLSLFACALIVYFARANPNTKVMQYESKLFGDEILTIDIQVDEEDWQELLDDPTAKEYIPADLVINGETFSSVGLRTKGNSSLTQVAQMKDSDRYSIHFKFNHYQKGQTYYGLDSFCINNLLGDNTYMKDYLSYDIMNYIGVPTPLANYAKVTVNGEDLGFYLALERYEKAFLDRVYDTSGGQLYNVKIQMGHREDFMDMNDRQKEEALRESGDNESRQPWDKKEGVEDAMENNSNESSPEQNRSSQDEQNKGGGFSGNMDDGFPQDMGDGFPQNRGGGFPGGRGGGPGGQNGGSLVYTDDNISSYSSIFDNAEFKKNTDKDKQRVITAIKNLNEGTNLEKYFDVDEILRYLAAHTVLVNLDSYSSSMAQNYYIYERDGKISILPWDYGLSFGGFQGGNISSTINFPIDTPVSGVSMEDRPLISKLLEVPEYKEKYHQYLSRIVDGYFNSGIFEETINVLDAKINDYVKNDTTSFTTYEKYTASLPILKELGALRARSIEGQLNGTIPSTTEGQNANKDSLISGDGINLSDLGSFMGRGGDRNRGDQGGQENLGRPIDQNRQGGAGAQGEFGAPGGFDGQDEPGDQARPGGRGDQEGVPGRQGRANTQGNTVTENTTKPAYMILTGILLLIVVITTYLLSRFKRRY